MNPVNVSPSELLTWQEAIQNCNKQQARCLTHELEVAQDLLVCEREFLQMQFLVAVGSVAVFIMLVMMHRDRVLVRV